MGVVALCGLDQMNKQPQLRPLGQANICPRLKDWVSFMYSFRNIFITQMALCARAYILGETQNSKRADKHYNRELWEHGVERPRKQFLRGFLPG